MYNKFIRVSEYIFYVFALLLPFCNRDWNWVLHSNSKTGIMGVNLNSDIVLFLLFSVFFLRFILFKHERLSFGYFMKDIIKTPLFLCLVTVLIMMFYSITYSEYKVPSLKESVRFLTYMILVIIVAYDFGKEEWKSKLKSGIYILAWTQCIIGIIQKFTGFMMIEAFSKSVYGYNKIHGTFENPNTFGAFLVLLFFPIAFESFYRIIRKKEYSAAVLPALIMINVIMCMSRNGLLGLIFGFITMAIIYDKRALYATAGMGAIGSVFVLSNRSIINMTQDDFRLSLWRYAKKMIEINPIKGIGNGSFRYTYNKYIVKFPQLKVRARGDMPPHNSYLKVWSELGFVVLLVFLASIYFGVKNVLVLIQNTVEEKWKLFFTGIGCSLITFVVMNINDDLFFVPKLTTYIWIVIAFAWGIQHRRSADGRGY